MSIVIPTLNAEAVLPGCLAALMDGVEAGLVRELVVSDGGSVDATRDIAQAAGAIWVEGPAGRGGQLRRGVAATSGGWLLVLHADTRLAPGWTSAVEAGMARGAPGYFCLRFAAPGLAPRLVAGWANLRARAVSMPFGDQGLLVSRADYEAGGGYPDIPLMEDMALMRRLPRARPLDAVAETGAARYLARGWLRQGGANLWRQARFLAGADPARLGRGYRD
ncbi:glycosyl transferase [Sinisalibacter aestuarii]|uniref:Glycosyl transferase n=1 Tax=Sinisalibacter aestuarii TaxID=2949426 RepID=A0ABQ5LX37_9RHOB|nr:glycosyl transferase [Sinisalibacter aestuarii]